MQSVDADGAVDGMQPVPMPMQPTQPMQTMGTGSQQLLARAGGVL